MRTGSGLAMAVHLTATQGRVVLLTDEWGRLHPVAPARLADSRTGLGTPAGRLTGAWRNIQVTGVGGVPSAGVAAVVVNLTAVGAVGPGYLSAWPAGQSETFTSNVNYRGGQVAANQAIVPVGSGGRIAVTAYGNATHLIVDVQGWFGDGTEVGGASLHPVAPQRLADSRSGLGLPAARLGAAVTRNVQVTGIGDVPAAGVQAVVVNITAVGASAASHLTLWPTGQARPPTSNLNVTPGTVVANQAIVPIGSGGRVPACSTPPARPTSSSTCRVGSAPTARWCDRFAPPGSPTPG